MPETSYAGGEHVTSGGRGTWKHAAFHVATIIATPAAYAPLPLALPSLGWPLREKINRKLIDYRLHGSSSMKIFRAFNALGAIAFSFGDAMLPEIQSTVKEPARTNMYKGVSAAYGVIILTYWQLAFTGYWAFGSQVQPYVVSSLAIPEWTIVMANIFAVIQISGCYQIYCRPTYTYLEEILPPKGENNSRLLRNLMRRLALTSIYIVLITLIAAAMPFFGDFVSICGAVGFTPLDFIFPALAFLKSGR